MINLTLGDYRICTLENGTIALCERHIIPKRSSPNLGKTVERKGNRAPFLPKIRSIGLRQGKWHLMIAVRKQLSN